MEDMQGKHMPVKRVKHGSAKRRQAHYGGEQQPMAWENVDRYALFAKDECKKSSDVGCWFPPYTGQGPWLHPVALGMDIRVTGWTTWPGLTQLVGVTTVSSFPEPTTILIVGTESSGLAELGLIEPLANKTKDWGFLSGTELFYNPAKQVTRSRQGQFEDFFTSRVSQIATVTRILARSHGEEVKVLTIFDSAEEKKRDCIYDAQKEAFVNFPHILADFRTINMRDFPTKSVSDMVPEGFRCLFESGKLEVNLAI